MILEALQDKGAYIMCFLIITLGLYGMVMKRNYIKKLIGMTVFQAAIILFYILSAYKMGASVPVLDKSKIGISPEAYVNPLPHALMLTSIVVCVATVGVGLSLLIRVYQGFRTLDEDALRKEMRS